jgi:hypothetical protein
MSNFGRHNMTKTCHTSQKFDFFEVSYNKLLLIAGFVAGRSEIVTQHVRLKLFVA